MPKSYGMESNDRKINQAFVWNKISHKPKRLVLKERKEELSDLWALEEEEDLTWDLLWHLFSWKKRKTKAQLHTAGARRFLFKVLTSNLKLSYQFNPSIKHTFCSMCVSLHSQKPQRKQKEDWIAEKRWISITQITLVLFQAFLEDLPGLQLSRQTCKQYPKACFMLCGSGWDFQILSFTRTYTLLWDGLPIIQPVSCSKWCCKGWCCKQDRAVQDSIKDPTSVFKFGTYFRYVWKCCHRGRPP